MLDRAYTKKELQKMFCPIAKRYNVKHIYLCGEYARGRPDKDTEINLFIEYGPEFNCSIWQELEHEIREMSCKRVNIVQTDRIYPCFPGFDPFNYTAVCIY